MNSLQLRAYRRERPGGWFVEIHGQAGLLRDFYTFSKSETELAYEIVYNMLLTSIQERRGQDIALVVCQVDNPLITNTLMGRWDMNAKVFSYSKRCLFLKSKLKRMGVTVRIE